MDSSGPSISSKISICILLLGCLLNGYAFESIEPIILSVLVLAVTYPINFMGLKKDRSVESRMYLRVYCVGWAITGVAAVYTNVLGDFLQLYSDAGTFYTLAATDSAGLTLDDLKQFTEGAGAVVLWRFFYDLFEAIGFEKQRYIGSLLNTCAVAYSGVLAIKAARLLDLQHAYQRLIILFSFCGLFWLFQGIHLRDSLGLLCCTALVYAWTKYLKLANFQSLLFLSLCSALSFLFFAYIRAEFLFVPLAMIISGITAISICPASKNQRKILPFVATCLGILVGLIGIYTLGDSISQKLQLGFLGYVEASTAGASSGSLGVSLVLSQALPLRLLFGSLYLYFFPVPFWTGFQLESAYHLFKSCNVVFFYFTAPLVITGLRLIYKNKANWKPELIFQVIIALGFTLSVAGTTLETRHIGSFFVPVFLIALVPKLDSREERKTYRKDLALLMLGVVLVHSLWAITKFA